MIRRQLIQRANTKRWFWGITIVLGLLLSFGINQRLQFREATAEAQEEVLPQLTAELDALKTEHKAQQAKWQSQLLVQIIPTLTDESRRCKTAICGFP